MAQVWRDGRKQTLLARILSGVDVRPLARGDDRRTGELLAASKSSDVVDAHLVLGVDGGDRVLTSDHDDIARLVQARGIEATLVST